MTSLFTRFVAQGVEVQAKAHFQPSEVVSADLGQAATVADTVLNAPAIQTSIDPQVSPNAVDGTQSPK